MNAERRVAVYTRDRATLTPHQRRRVVHKARGKERAAALALIAALVAAGVSCAEGGPGNRKARTVAVGTSTSLPPTTVATTTTTAPPPPTTAARASRSRPVPVLRGSDTGAGGCSLDYIRAHENPHDPSGSPYGRSTNASHFGAFQFDRQTWAANGGSPSTWGTASADEQERVAATTYARRGSQPWSVCKGRR